MKKPVIVISLLALMLSLISLIIQVKTAINDGVLSDDNKTTEITDVTDHTDETDVEDGGSPTGPSDSPEISA